MSKFPVLFAGQRFTATLAGQMEPDYYIKNSNTARASTITPTADPDLTIPVLVGEVCLCEFYVRYNPPAITTPPLLITQWTLPAGTTVSRQVGGPGSAASEANADNQASRWGVHGSTSSVTYGSRVATGNSLWVYEWSIVTVGAVAGNVALAWAQSVSSASAVTVAAGSFARHTRIS